MANIEESLGKVSNFGRFGLFVLGDLVEFGLIELGF